MTALPTKPTVLTLHERDITSEVCQRCAKCCEIDIQLPNTNSRYRQFLRGVGYTLSPPPVEGQDDCCDKVHDATLHLGPCRHLDSQVDDLGITLFSCRLHGDLRRPQLCEEFNCVSWAKTRGEYSIANQFLFHAERAIAGARRIVGVNTK